MSGSNDAPDCPAEQPAPAAAHGPGVNMIRADLRDIPRAALPEGCTIRGMSIEDAAVWADIWRDAENAPQFGTGIFYREFGDDPASWAHRCYLLADERGILVGTIAAWYSRDFLGQDYGRIHWFGIRPSHQKRGLARPLLSYAMNRLAEWHERAWLATSIERLAAIKLYLDYGFAPLIQSGGDADNWRKVRASLTHPGIDAATDLRGASRQPDQ